MKAQPVQQNERAIIVDIIRGFALLGVLFANFTGYTYQNIPAAVFNKSASAFDQFIINFHLLFFEWKFMTIFSILFGYGFGLILSSIERKGLNPTPFFLRRMFWLFVIGILHSLFWWGDVLHLYAFSGVFLLLFRKASDKIILATAFVFMFIAPVCITLLWNDHPSYFTEENLQVLYEKYKFGNLSDVFIFNTEFYFNAFILTGGDLQDCMETLGRFLFGYYLLRIRLFDSVQLKKSLFKKSMVISALIALIYFIVVWLSIKGQMETADIFWEPLLKLGIFSTSCFYSCVVVLLFITCGKNRSFAALQAIGSMTLTNYLLISIAMISLLYGIGFGKLGEIPMHIIWLLGIIFLLIEVTTSKAWLTRFRYGPAEWIWRQLTYRQIIKLRK